MTVIDLIDELVRALDKLFEAEYLKAKSGEYKRVKVFAQYLPQAKSAVIKPKGEAKSEYQADFAPADYEDNFPCVIVKLGELTDGDEGKLDQAIADINLLVGIYDKSADNQGWRDVMNIIEKVRLYLWQQRYLAARFRLEPELHCYLFDDQPLPLYFGVIETRWDVPRPQEPQNFNNWLMQPGQ